MTSPPTDAVRCFDALVEEVIETRWRSSPITATFDGVAGHDHRIDDYSVDAIADSLRDLERQIDALEGIEAQDLDAKRRIDRRALLGALSADLDDWSEVRSWTVHANLYPELALYSVYALAVRTHPSVEQRLVAIRERLSALPRLLEQGIANLDRPPAPLVDMALEICAGGPSVLTDVIGELAKGRGSLESEIRRESGRACDALEDYERALKRLEPADDDAARWAIGRRAFEHRLRHAHGIEMHIDALVEIGRAVREQAETDLEALAKELDGPDDWRAQIAAAKQDHPGAEDLVAAYRDEVHRARRFVVERGLVSLPADESLEVVETPEFERPQLPYAAIVPPPPMGPPLPGRFYVTPVGDAPPGPAREARLQRHARAAIPIIAVHEGYPGHHLQFSRARNARSAVRMLYGTPVAWEGWALYCEQMMYEQGFYRSPLVRLFQLRDLLWRALRIEIDVGLHCRNLAPADAARMLVDGAALEPEAAAAEVNRYLVTPTQPLSYLVGRELILDLRRDVAANDGSAFELGRFHDRVLDHGHLSPAHVREAMLPSPGGQRTPTPRSNSLLRS